ncbi:IspD/TarI family cytidylyltransferase [Jonesia quinghaiensis]|uniref:IspD/TarI family cytidylyltransferase n=1 Tax=Jonesia quinghaiensis TaxID=262806 RepID=UPI0004055A5B|nr:IspD/TarI family cytidylyltransferase [Jonesia quinghaiensis]
MTQAPHHATPHTDDAHHTVVGIVTAAGAGTRLGYSMPKALVPLDPENPDTALVVEAVRRMLGVEGMAELVVTAPQEHRALCATLLARCFPDHGERITVVTGGATRQASVACGVEALAARSARSDTAKPVIVLVHDAARVLAPTAMMQRLVDTVAAGHDAVIPVLPVADSIVRVGAARGTENYPVDGAVDRRDLRIVQTPQAFPFPVLAQAHAAFHHEGRTEITAFTDDASLVAAHGHNVLAVIGDHHAAKVTTPADLVLARLTYQQETHP